MTIADVKKQVYALIEDLDLNESAFTKDPDYSAKMNYVINIIQNELARIKKLPSYKAITVDITEKDTYTMDDIDDNVYQIKMVKGIDYEYRANNTIIKALEDGTMEVEYFKYPTQINTDTLDSTELDISIDVAEILPIGVAADLLKSDVSNNYGKIYEQRYQQMKQELDVRYNLGQLEIVGGTI